MHCFFLNIAHLAISMFTGLQPDRKSLTVDCCLNCDPSFIKPHSWSLIFSFFQYSYLYVAMLCMDGFQDRTSTRGCINLGKVFCIKTISSSYRAATYLFVSIYVNERLHRIYSASLQNSKNKTWADTKKQPPAIIQSFGPKLSHVE